MSGADSHRTSTRPAGPATRLIAPTALCDYLDLHADRDIRLRLDAGTITIGAAHAPAIDAPFSDYQRLRRTTPPQQITITTADLRNRLTTGPTRTISGAPHDTNHQVSVPYASGETTTTTTPTPSQSTATSCSKPSTPAAQTNWSEPSTARPAR